MVWIEQLKNKFGYDDVNITGEGKNLKNGVNTLFYV